LNEEQRREPPDQKQNYEGGTDYDYGARDFGDVPVDTSQARPEAATRSDAQDAGGKSSGPTRSEERHEPAGKVRGEA
jgi:hypothetical protein